MSAPRLYRALLKNAKAYDRQPWRRSNLLHQPSLHKYTAGAQASGIVGRTAFFLEAGDSNTTQRLVQHHFRRAATEDRTTPIQHKLNTAFEVLRALKGHSSCTTAASTSKPRIDLDGIEDSPSMGMRRSSGSTPRGASSTSLRAPVARRAVHSQSLMAGRGLDSLMDRYDSSPMSSSSGPALHAREAEPTVEYGAHTSILGRLHEGAIAEFLQKPRTPTPTLKDAAKQQQLAPTNPNHDSKYADAIFQCSVYGAQYLELISAAPSTHSNTSCESIEPHNELHYIDASRMKHQHAKWEARMTGHLSHSHKLELESLVRTLGEAVEANSLERVLAFQAQLPLVDRSLAVPLLSNNRVMDAWFEFLAEKKEYCAIIQLFRARLESGMLVSEYGLSRASQCRVLVACAIEGDASASVMALRETSWAALATSDAAASHRPGVPSSVNQLPSWIPSYYSSDAAEAAVSSAALPRSTFEAEEAPDGLLAAAGDGFGIETEVPPSPTPVSVVPASLLRPVAQKKPRLSVSLNARPIRPLSPLTTAAQLGLTPAGGNLQHAAAMSTSARAMPQQPEPSPHTPLPIIDLWTELSLDSRLMELAIIAAARSESRAAEFKQRDELNAIAMAAKRNPLTDNEELNLSMHEHAAAIFEQQRRARSTLTRQTPNASVDPEAAPRTVFEAMNDPASRSPLAFQLWSVMLQQQIPLRHSRTYVELLDNLQANLACEEAPLTPAMSNLLLDVLTGEMRHARSVSNGGALKSTFLRGDVETFLRTELAVNQQLASLSVDGGMTHLWQCLDVFRTMAKEGVRPSNESLAQFYRAVLELEFGYGRSKLMQDLVLIVEDLGEDTAVEAILDIADPVHQAELPHSTIMQV